MSVKIIGGTPQQAETRARLVAKASTSQDKWSPSTVPDNQEIPDIIALPPFILLSSSTRQTVVAYTGSPTFVTDQDRINSTTLTSQTKNGHSLVVSGRFEAGQTLNWTSGNPDVATVVPTGPFTAVLDVLSDGATTITATLTPSGLSTSVTLSCSIVNQSELTVFYGFVEGSLAHHCENAVNSRIQDATTAMLPIFSVQNHTTQTYVRNTNCWIYDLSQQATCISPWNSTGGITRAGTLITPRHFIFAAHYELSVGATVRFISADNQVVNRTMLARRRHPSYSPYWPDLTVGVLDQDVPESITPCKVLPSNYEAFFPTGTTHIATLGLDQEEKALVTDLSYLNQFYAGFKTPNLPYEQVLYESKIVGDSGNPAFLIINNNLVLLTCWTFGGAGAGTFITPQISAINQMIVDVDTLAGNGGTGYTLTEVDLSGFTNFSS
jgi:hypothetical protein